MYATLVKMRYAWTAIAFAVIFTAIGIWYTQPVDVYGLDQNLSIDRINISLIRSEAGMADDDLQDRSVTFERGEEGFDDALARVEALEFKRPFKNLMPTIPFLQKEHTVKTIEDYEYHIYVHLAAEGSEVWDLTLSGFFDEWEYRKDTFDQDYPLNVTKNTESMKSFGDHFWEMAA